MAKVDPALERIPRLGGLLGIKTAPVVERLASLVGSWRGPLVATIPHRFDALAITCRVPRDTAREVCGGWLDALAGDDVALELGAATTVAHSDEAALPAEVPPLVRTLGDDVASVSWDGEAWTYALEQANDDAALEATLARIESIATALGVTEPQRRIGGRLHRSLARGMPTRIWVRARGSARGDQIELDPIVGLAWDLVEWLPIQHMMSGFYPQLDAATKIGRLQRNAGIEHATVELVLGPADPPGMRLLVQVDEVS